MPTVIKKVIKAIIFRHKLRLISLFLMETHYINNSLCCNSSTIYIFLLKKNINIIFLKSIFSIITESFNMFTIKICRLSLYARITAIRPQNKSVDRQTKVWPTDWRTRAKMVLLTLKVYKNPFYFFQIWWKIIRETDRKSDL